MHSGSTFLRYRAKVFGPPVRKSMFYRDTEKKGGCLYLTDVGKRLDDTAKCVPLSEVCDIYLGKQTPSFRRHVAKPAPVERCFTIALPYETLDFEARSADDREVWIVGLMGVMKMQNHDVKLHRVPLFVPRGLEYVPGRGQPVRYDFSLSCRSLPKANKLFKNRYPLVRLFEKDPQRGKYHFLAQTEVARKGKRFDPRFDTKLSIDYYAAEEQMVAFVVSFHSSAEKLKFKYRLGWAEILLSDLVKSEGAERSLQLENPQKKSYNRKLAKIRALVHVRSHRSSQVSNIYQYHNNNSGTSRSAIAEKKKVVVPSASDFKVPDYAALFEGKTSSSTPTSKQQSEAKTAANLDNTMSTIDLAMSPSQYGELTPLQRLGGGGTSSSSSSLDAQRLQDADDNLSEDLRNQKRMMHRGRSLTLYMPKQAPLKQSFFHRSRMLGPGALFWCAAGERTEASTQSISLDSVSAIYLGKQTPVFPSTAPEDRCFSVATAKGAINLEAKTTQQRDVWAFGLLGLCRAAGQKCALHD
jgi:hypothetical protein